MNSATKNVYLDDHRPAPRGWIRTYTAEETIAQLRSGDVDELSLDYNLGPESNQTGAAVLRWIEHKIATDPDWIPPRSIRIHSTHRVGRSLMIQLLKDIRRRLLEAGREPPATGW